MQEFDQPRILIVDDATENIDILGNALSDYKKMVALNGGKALELAMGNNPPDLILLDIMMPGMDGFEVCRKLKSKPSTKDIPIIFITSNTDSESIVKGFELGAVDYITKPFNIGELMARVSTQLELKNSREKLRESNELLEQRVEERTVELKKAHAELEAVNLKLVTLDEAKSEFLNIISHQLRTPLNGIMGALEVLKLQEQSEENAEVINYLNESAFRLKEFTDVALKFTNLKVHIDNIDKSELSLNEVIKEALSSLSNKISKKNIDINFEDSDQNFLVMGSSDLLLTTFKSIIDNSITYSEKGITISISIHKHENFALCEIIDEGQGFSESALMNIFRPFSPGEPFTDENKGLSLALCRMIMELHKGSINIKNNETKGATVTLKFAL